MNPVFLGLDEVVEIHRDQIHRYGGSEGIRDLAGLQSAIAMPRSGFGGEYFHTDLHEMAAAYLYHLAKNHPFVDGNKRVGAATALVFLSMNGVEVRMSSEALVDLVLGAVEGRISKAGVAEALRRSARRAR